MKSIVLWTSVALLNGCGPKVDLSAPSIIGGRAVPKTAVGLIRHATVALTTPDLIEAGHSFCTATLVAPRVLLTAGHCVVDDAGARVEGAAVAVMGVKVDEDSEPVSIRAAYVYKDYAPLGLGAAETTPMNDLGLLILAATLGDSELAPIASTPLAARVKLVVAGFGVTKTRANNNTGRLRQVAVTIDHVATRGRIFVAKGADDSGACAGDSGGPAYHERSGRWELAGVTSFGKEVAKQPGGPRICTGENGYVDLSFYAEAIKNALTDSGPSHSVWRRVD